MTEKLYLITAAAIQADQLKALTEVVRLSEEMGLYDNKDAEGKA